MVWGRCLRLRPIAAEVGEAGPAPNDQGFARGILGCSHSWPSLCWPDLASTRPGHLLVISLVRVHPGPQSLAWLGATINELKGGQALAPVSVVVASNHVGLAARRRLASRGYANVRFGVMSRLAEPLGAPVLAAAGKSPLTWPSEAAAIREAVRHQGEGFGEVGQHGALIRTLTRLFRELRAAEPDATQLEDLAGSGMMAQAAVSVFKEYRRLVSVAGLYDDHDLFGAATAALTGSPPSRLGSEMGPVVVYLPVAQTGAQARLLRALSSHARVCLALADLGDSQADRPAAAMARALDLDWEQHPALQPPPSDVRLLVAPDATEEVRSVVRLLLSRLEQGQAAGRAAILYREFEPYGALIRDTLDAAGVPWAGIDGRPLSQSWAGRGLIGLLRLRQRDFARVDVLDWLGTLPEADPGHVSIGDWDRFSRQAAVVQGAGQWQNRLRRHADGVLARAQRLEESEAGAGEIRYLRRQASSLERMASHIERAETATRAPGERTWSALSSWAERMRRAFIPAVENWPVREIEADEMVTQVLDQMASAGVVEREVGVERFVEACQAALDDQRQMEGRLGSGVVVGPIGAVCGMEFDSVFVLGATERALPQPAPPDPFFPPGGGSDPLGRVERRRSEERRDFLSAIATAGSQHVSFPAWDANLRPCYPSPWVVEVARPNRPGSATASALRRGQGATNVEVIQSPDAGLGRAPAFLNVAEWRTASAQRCAGRLSASGLAARADLPLGRHLQVRAARGSDRFSEFDGNIESEVASLPMLAAGVEGGRLSASGIESWAACPFRYLLKQLIKVEATERPEVDTAWGMSATTRGTLVHDVLRQFFTELTSQQRPGVAERFGARDRRRIEELALEEFARLEEAGATGQRLAWENERRAILSDLQSFLRADEELRTDGLIPTFFEQGFGMPGDSWEPVVVEIGGGRGAQLRGRIDRVDLGPDPLAPQSARLIDYKTSKDYPEGDFAVDPVAAGTRVQPAVYAAAIRARFPGLRVQGGYWFVTAKGHFKFLAVPDDQGRLRDVLEVMDRSLKAGAFQQVPGPPDGRDPANWTNCRYCAFDRICPTGRDQMQERKRGHAGSRVHGELAFEPRS